MALARAAWAVTEIAHFSAWRTERKCAADLVRFGKTLHDQAMVGGTDGNLSVRLDSGRIMITPSGVSKGEMKVREMAIVNMNGDKLSGCRNPSSELGMHQDAHAKTRAGYERPLLCGLSSQLKSANPGPARRTAAVSCGLPQ